MCNRGDSVSVRHADIRDDEIEPTPVPRSADRGEPRRPGRRGDDVVALPTQQSFVGDQEIALDLSPCLTVSVSVKS